MVSVQAVGGGDRKGGGGGERSGRRRGFSKDTNFIGTNM